MNDANTSCGRILRKCHQDRRRSGLLYAFVWGSLLAAALANAQTASTPAPSAPAASDVLTYKGITLYGTVDLGLQYQTHGAPINDYFPAGSADIVQKNSNHSITGITPNNLSQSKIGLQGVESIAGDWSGVFKLETFFNPQSGEISDALKSLAQNNGRSVASARRPRIWIPAWPGNLFNRHSQG